MQAEIVMGSTHSRNSRFSLAFSNLHHVSSDSVRHSNQRGCIHLFQPVELQDLNKKPKQLSAMKTDHKVQRSKTHYKLSNIPPKYKKVSSFRTKSNISSECLQLTIALHQICFISRSNPSQNISTDTKTKSEIF